MNPSNLVDRNLCEDARYFEYTSAVDPSLPKVPFAVFGADLHEHGATRVVELDLSKRLSADAACTSPNMLANFLRLRADESLVTRAVATSQVFYAIRGAGRTGSEDAEIEWKAGDLFTLPACGAVEHDADVDSALYWVHDEPLLAYLGVVPCEQRFRPTLYPRETMLAELARANSEPRAMERNRNGVLFGNEATPLTASLTHTLWALFNALPARVVQKAHRHNSVALDLCVSAGPNTYTLMSDTLDARGELVNPVRADWKSGAVFVTPPGLWHSHHNESDVDAIVLPIQDAALHTWMRTLDIRFT